MSLRSDAVRGLLGFALLLVALGYYGGSTDLWQYLLPARVLFEPGFLTNDWFTHQTTPYHYAFQWLFAQLWSRQLVDVGLLVWHATTIAILTWATWRWTTLLGGGNASFFLALGALVLGVRDVWGDQLAIDSHALPSMLAIALGFWALAAVVAKRPITVAVLVAATTYAHVNVGMWTIGIVGLMEATEWQSWTSNPRTWVAALVFALLIAPVALLVGRDFGDGSDDTSIFMTLFYGRSPHHYAPHLASLRVHVQTALVFVLGLAVVVTSSEHRRPLWALWWGTAAAAVAGVFFLVVVYWAFPVRLFPYRALSWLVMFAHIGAAARVLAPQTSSTSRMLVGGLLSASLLLGTSTIAALAFLAVALAFIRLPLAKERWRLLAARALVVAAVIIAAVGYASTYRLPYRWHWMPGHQAHQLAALRDHTPNDAVLLVPPGFSGVRLAAERAVVVDFKNFPMHPKEIRGWRERMLAITGLDPAQARIWYPPRSQQPIGRLYDDAYDRLDCGPLATAAARYGASHVVLRSSSACRRALSQRGVVPLYEDKRIALYTLTKVSP
jgi:hypothetical protein